MGYPKNALQPARMAASARASFPRINILAIGSLPFGTFSHYRQGHIGTDCGTECTTGAVLGLIRFHWMVPLTVYGRRNSQDIMGTSGNAKTALFTPLLINNHLTPHLFTPSAP